MAAKKKATVKRAKKKTVPKSAKKKVVKNAKTTPIPPAKKSKAKPKKEVKEKTGNSRSAIKKKLREKKKAIDVNLKAAIQGEKFDVAALRAAVSDFIDTNTSMTKGA